MDTGISIYPGLRGSIREKTGLIEEAAALGIHRLFTSFHIPETDAAAFHRELEAVLASARENSMDVVADISPTSAALLGMDRVEPVKLAKLGITTVRFDDGFDVEKIALYSQVIQVQLNASTLTEDSLKELQKKGARLEAVDGLHNFYPRPHTGLDRDYFIAQTNLLQSYGLSVGAFIASSEGRRAPLSEGLPTLEEHRRQPVSLAARHLAALGLQSVFIGDDWPSLTELRELSRAGREETGVVVLKARFLIRDPYVQDLLSHTFTSRPDPSRDVVRAGNSRSLLDGRIVEPDSAGFRSLRRGDITIDNVDFLRYMGEVQIVKRELEPEERTNIAAKILPEEEFLIDTITPGRKFRFEFIR
jgi:hypothetical protein